MIFEKGDYAFAVYKTEPHSISIMKVKIVDRFESKEKRHVYIASDQFEQTHFFQDVELFDSLVNINEVIEAILSESEDES